MQDWDDYIEFARKGPLPTEWKHGFIPLTPKAAAIKAKKAKGSANDGGTQLTPEAKAQLSEKQRRELKLGETATAGAKPAQESKGSTSRFKGTTEDLGQKPNNTVTKARRLAIAAGLPSRIADDPKKASAFLAEVIKREDAKPTGNIATKRKAIAAYIGLLKKQQG